MESHASMVLFKGNEVLVRKDAVTGRFRSSWDTRDFKIQYRRTANNIASIKKLIERKTPNLYKAFIEGNMKNKKGEKIMRLDREKGSGASVKAYNDAFGSMHVICRGGKRRQFTTAYCFLATDVDYKLPRGYHWVSLLEYFGNQHKTETDDSLTIASALHHFAYEDEKGKKVDWEYFHGRVAFAPIFNVFKKW